MVTDRGTPAPLGVLAAVLFDMDGTLLDSERVWDVALADLATHLGGTLSAEARVSMIGSSLDRSIAIVADDLGVDTDRDAAGRFLLGRAETLFRTDLEWKPGARELLEAVTRAGIPTGLVTSTHRRLTEIALDAMGRQFFTVSVCGDELPRPKPNPDPYLRAAELLSVPADRCVAIEDSPLGVRAAEAAGCAVVAVPETAIEPAPGTVVRTSLVGLTLDDLAALVRDRAGTPGQPDRGGTGSRGSVSTGRSG